MASVIVLINQAHNAKGIRLVCLTLENNNILVFFMSKLRALGGGGQYTSMICLVILFSQTFNAKC